MRVIENLALATENAAWRAARQAAARNHRNRLASPSR